MSLLLLLMGTISSSQAQDLKEPPKPEVEYVHEFWQKGKHAKELALGSYVVVAQTTSEADAKKLIREFKHLEIPIPIYGYQSNKGFWLICFAVDGDIPEVKARHKKYLIYTIYNSAWMLTIHE